MTADDLLFHLRMVIQTTERERVSQRYLDTLDKKLAVTPQWGDPYRKELLDKKRSALSAVRHHRRLAVYATKLAEAVAYPETPKMVKTSTEKVA